MRQGGTASAILLVLFFCLGAVSADAEMYQWTDGHGVVHFSSEAPSGVNATKLDEEHTRPSGSQVSWRDQYQKICASSVSLHGYSSNLLETYLHDLRRIKVKALQGADDEEAGAIEEQFAQCSKRVRGVLELVRNQEAAKEIRESRADEDDQRFEQLHEVVMKKLDERRRSKKAYAREGIQFYSDLRRMEVPLKYGMTMDKVRSLWKEPMRVQRRGSSSGEYEHWYYPMDINLMFEDGTLTHWNASY